MCENKIDDMYTIVIKQSMILVNEIKQDQIYDDYVGGVYK